METMDNHQSAWLDEALPGGPLRVLDAGCGRGELAAELLRRGHDVTAIDVSAQAVEAARAAGVPARQADLAHYYDAPFDAIVMSLSLHHMHPLDAVLEGVSALLKRGGTLAVDEFAWDWADSAAAAWFYDVGSLLAAAGLADFPGEAVDDPVARWREAHVDHTPAADMLAAIKDRFEGADLRREPYLSRYIAGKLTNGSTELVNGLWRIERGRIASGTLPPTGFRLVARQV
ncbi:class I SAM-dependent methyltransferase [Nonomuraea purpurea]|uniref:Class I SAM-dependent methyltransferase n=1 Tax=Nonomuraea purpurea TaxID=1849276 RepID=A0ABV8G154_9ACTN